MYSEISKRCVSLLSEIYRLSLFVALMGIEFTGFAKQNYATVYSPIAEHLPALSSLP